MTMLDKCARALWACDPASIETPFEKLSPCALDNLYDTARAVLGALREPTSDMIDEGVEYWHTHEDFLDTEVAGAFTAMIDEALKERT